MIYDAQQVTEYVNELKNRNFQKTLDLPPYGSCIKQVQTATETVFRLSGKQEVAQ